MNLEDVTLREISLPSFFAEPSCLFLLLLPPPCLPFLFLFSAPESFPHRAIKIVLGMQVQETAQALPLHPPDGFW